MKACVAVVVGSTLLGALVSGTARAATVNAASCARSAVAAAIHAARDGDTVSVPAGTAVWGNSVSIGQAITLQGAGMGKTVITDATHALIRVAGGKPFRITGFEFVGTGNPNSTSITLGGGRYIGFRIDHCKFHNERHAVNIDGVRAEGVIDNCAYACLEAKGGGDHVAIYASGEGLQAWKRPPGFGTSDAVFIEDCTFEYFSKGNSDRPYLGMGSGARVVFRHNTARNGCFEAFSASSRYTSTRGVFFEAYNNILSGTCYCLFTLKGGTGNIFSNTVTGYSAGCFELTDYRIRNYGAAMQYGRCDGMNSRDGNEPIEAGAHTGGNNQSILTCAGRNWTTDQWVGYALWNVTDDSVGRITANTATTMTTADGMQEGCTIADSGRVTAVSGTKMTCAGKRWQWGGLKDFCHVRNVTDGSAGLITANGADTITAALAGGAGNAWHIGDAFQVTYLVPHGGIEKDWDTGDRFKITDGHAGMDQIGRGQDASETAVQPQSSCPLYAWANTINGADLAPRVHKGGTHPHSEPDLIRAGRDYFVDTPRPGYTPYAYPHPLRSAAAPPWGDPPMGRGRP